MGEQALDLGYQRLASLYREAGTQAQNVQPPLSRIDTALWSGLH